MPVFDFIRNSDGAKGSKRLVEERSFHTPEPLSAARHV